MSSLTSSEVTAGNTALDTAQAVNIGVVNAQTFTLTDSADDYSGAAGNDTFNGALSTTAGASTLTAGDKLVGGAGNDILKVTVSGTATGDLYETPRLTGIEEVVVSNSRTNTTGDSTIDLDLADSALLRIETTASLTNDAVTRFVNIDKIVDVAMAGFGDLYVRFDAAVVAGSSDSLSLTLNGVGSSDSDSEFNISGIENLTITNNVAASYLDLDPSGVGEDSTVTIIASKALTIELDMGDVVDASASTAALSFRDFNSAVTVTGGSANDSFDFGDELGAEDALAGGGGTDTLEIEQGTGGVVDDAFTNVTSIETLTLGTGTGAVTLGAEAMEAGIVTVNMTAVRQPIPHDRSRLTPPRSRSILEIAREARPSPTLP